MATDFSPIEGYFRYAYSKKVADLVPENAVVTKTFGLNKNVVKTGRAYKQPVEITRNSGHTSSRSTDAYDLNDPIGMVAPEATVTPCSITLPTLLSYTEITSAKEAASKGDQVAFVNMTQHRMKRLVQDTTYLQELQFLWGCGATPNNAAGALDNLGEILTCTRVGSTDQVVLVLTAESWASGIWAGMKNARIDIRAVTAGTVRDDTYPVINTVDPSARSITVTGTWTSKLANVAPGDHIHYAGANASDYGNQMTGFSQILTNTGELFGIDAAEYDLWKANQVSVNGPLTFPKVTQGLRRASDLSFRGETVLVTCAASWANLNSDQAALVVQPSGTQDKYGIGAGRLFYRTEAGLTEVVSSPYMKEGVSMLMPKNCVQRLGSEQGSFDPSGRGFKIQDHPSKNGAIIRYYSNQGVLVTTPAFCTIFTGITPTV